jgi:hypothetical protein
VSVSGTVTLDGKPLPDAVVRFIPTGDGTAPARPALGRTNSNGSYSLEFSTSLSGALPGSYRVEISTGRLPDDGRKGVRIPGAPETVPDSYNSKSTLVEEVRPQHNTINFELKSTEGSVSEPRDATR